MFRGTLPKSLNDLVIITGHRGMGVTEKPRHQFFENVTSYPENSLEAFTIALGYGIHSIECDIHVSQDGEPMVIHGSKIAPYADLISTQGMDEKSQALLKEWLLCIPSEQVDPKSISLDDTLQVEKFTTKVLQSCFSLKSYDVEIEKTRLEGRSNFFDELNSKEKIALSSTERQVIIDKKDSLLKTNPQRHQIPTLTQLLHLLYDKNKARSKTPQPNIKLNIELKGKGSAIASIFALLEFYEQTPDAKEHVKPEDIIFLGKREVGEISIANAMLKNHTNFEVSSHFEVPELFNHFMKTDSPSKKKVMLKYHSERALLNLVVNLFAPHAPFNRPEISDFTRNTILLMAYLKAGGKPGDFLNFLKSIETPYPSIENFLVLKNVPLQLKHLANNAECKEQDNSYWNKRRKKEVKCKRALEDLAQLNSCLIAASTEDDYLKIKMRDLFANHLKHTVTQIKTRLDTYNTKKKNSADESECSEDIQFHVILQMITNQLKRCKTNLMLSTGDLFGVENLIPEDPDFNIKEGIVEITSGAKSNIKEALIEYQYDGIDISLFDYCGSVLDALEEAITEGKLDRDKLILGASASNWRAAKIDNTEETTQKNIKNPYEVPKRALDVVKVTQVPLLVKVDEPGCFHHLKNELARLEMAMELEKQIPAPTRGPLDSNNDDPFTYVDTVQRIN